MGAIPGYAIGAVANPLLQLLYDRFTVLHQQPSCVASLTLLATHYIVETLIHIRFVYNFLYDVSISFHLSFFLVFSLQFSGLALFENKPT